MWKLNKCYSCGYCFGAGRADTNFRNRLLEVSHEAALLAQSSVGAFAVGALAFAAASRIEEFIDERERLTQIRRKRA